MARLHHRDDEEITLSLTVTFPKAVLDRFKSMRIFGFTKLPVNTLLAEYLSGCLRDFGRYEWDDQIVDTLTDDQLDEVIDMLEHEREFRAEVAAEEGPDEPDYLDIEAVKAQGAGMTVDPRRN